jgi:ribosome-binding protein aMBF1 (putative translation factor)
LCANFDNDREQTINVHDVVAQGWRSSAVTQAVRLNPEMRPLIASVIEATRKLLGASSKELAAALTEQEQAIAALERYIESKQLVLENAATTNK